MDLVFQVTNAKVKHVRREFEPEKGLYSPRNRLIQRAGYFPLLFCLSPCNIISSRISRYYFLCGPLKSSLHSLVFVLFADCKF